MSERPHPITLLVGSLFLAVATGWVVWANSQITPNWQRLQHELWIFYVRAGDNNLAQGKISEALEVHRAGLVVAQRLVAADLDERDAAISHMKIGQVLVAQGSPELALKAFQQGLALAERLPTGPDVSWYDEMMLSHEALGDLLAKETNSVAALEEYRSAVGLAKWLATAEPGNARWQSCLLRLHLKMGNTLVDHG
jgi:tetratricopeptide (TPR) repeat protein